MDIKLKHKKYCGIYCIFNIENEKFYIGSSKDIYYRLHRHKSDLKKNRHANPILQNIYNKYPNRTIAFIIKLCDDKELIKWEQHYINSWNPYINIIRDAEFNNAARDSQEVRDKISSTLKEGYKSGRINTSSSDKEVLVYFRNTGLICGEYASIKRAALALNLSLNSCRKAACGERDFTQNYIFRYKYNDNRIVQPILLNSSGRKHKIQLI